MAEKLDIVVTSQACYNIKQKISSTAFGRPKKTIPIHLSDIEADLIRQVSPNMMRTKQKTKKEIKMEQKIHSLFENEPLFQFQEQ
jgi:hypothetical protein